MKTVKLDDDRLLIPAGRHTLSAHEVGQRQRERLLRAIVRCSAERGYADATIADVVRVARTSRSAFYEHFADKEDCFLAAYEQMTGAFIDASLQAAAGAQGWKAKLEAGIATYFCFMAEHPEVAASTVLEIHGAGRRALAARSRALKRWMRTIEALPQLAAREGVTLAPATEVAAAAIVLTCESYVHDYARRGRVRRVEEAAPQALALAHTLVVHGVR
jgi:AcrR family transcriptional regulator